MACTSCGLLKPVLVTPYSRAILRNSLSPNCTNISAMLPMGTGPDKTEADSAGWTRAERDAISFSVASLCNCSAPSFLSEEAVVDVACGGGETKLAGWPNQWYNRAATCGQIETESEGITQVQAAFHVF